LPSDANLFGADLFFTGHLQFEIIVFSGVHRLKVLIWVAKRLMTIGSSRKLKMPKLH
jgi:hypothetical protein